MAKLLLIFFCIALGMAFRRFKIMPENAAATLNRFVIWVSLPALVLYYIHRIDLSTTDAHSLFAPVLMPWMLFFGAWGFLALIGKWRGWDRRTIGALVLTCGLGNTAFVGFAMIDALYGAEGLQTAVLIDQLGSFLALSTLGIMVAIFYAGQTLSWGVIVRKVLTFPPFAALFLAFALMPVEFPQELNDILLILSGTLVPLTMLSVGLQLNVSLAALQRHKSHLFFGLGYKLALAPAVFYLLYGLFMSPDDVVFRVIVLEAAMAPMVTAGILAAEYDLRGELAALIVGIGITLSLATVPLMNLFLW
ncbi:MAG: AEC family transporter [Alphaproteobacteria bacterium]|nr:AEC family transporter [Alphaproteobacteria bacterium]